jgi:hypothetical protein
MVLVVGNVNEAVVGSGRFSVWQESDCWFFVHAFGRNLASVAVILITVVLVSFNTGAWHLWNGSRAHICENNAVVTCITLKHKNGLSFSTLMGHTLS